MCYLCELRESILATVEPIDPDNLPPNAIDESFSIDEANAELTKIADNGNRILTVRQFAAIVLLHKMKQRNGSPVTVGMLQLVIELYAKDFFFDAFSRVTLKPDGETEKIRVIITRPMMKVEAAKPVEEVKQDASI